MSMLNFLKRNSDARKVFGQRELRIIEKQLWGMQLTQSEKNRLSRDIRKKLEFIKKIAEFKEEFKLKHGTEVRKLIEETKEVITNHKWFRKIRKIFVFGSVLTKENNLSSDIDIGVIFDKVSKKEAINFRKDVLSSLSEKIDIQVYNVLPKKVRKSIDARKRIIYEK